MSSSLPTGSAVEKDILRNYIIPFMWNGTMQESVDVLRHVFPVPVDFFADLELSLARALVDPTSNNDFDILKNGVSIGTMTFEAGSPTAVIWTFPDDVSFAVGDMMQITSPASIDASLADICGTIVGKR